MVESQPSLFDDTPKSTAHFSEDRRYRYSLRRYWDMTKPPALFCGVNPSVAAEVKNDPTVTREIDFAKSWGCGWYIKVNAYPFIATDPKVMKQARKDGVDVEDRATNLRVIAEFIQDVVGRNGKVIVAWGTNIDPDYQHDVLRPLFDLEREDLPDRRYRAECLGMNQDSSPRHPLYLAKTTPLVPWTPVRLAR